MEIERRLQEECRSEWQTFVANILLNRAGGETVRRVFSELIFRWPTPELMAKADRETLTNVLRPCGFQRMRAKHLIAMSKEYLRGDWERPSDLPGLGEYANESWEIFIKKNYTIEPRDRQLARYLAYKNGISQNP